MSNYRKLPIIVEAIQLKWGNWNEICDFLGDIINKDNPGHISKTCSFSCGEIGPYIELTIPTLEGNSIARHGDFIVKGIIGEFYPCNPDVFEKTFELVKKA